MNIGFGFGLFFVGIVVYVAVLLAIVSFVAWWVTPIVFKRWREMERRYPR